MKAAVVGAGAWGTALASLLCKNGHDTTLWCRTPEKAAQMQETHINPRLSQVTLPEKLKFSGDPACAAGCSMVVIACPSFPIRSVCRTVAPFIPKDAVVVSVTKGIEEGTLLRMSQVVSQETGHETVVALSGPCHAEEVAIGLPTGCLAACEDKASAEFVQDAFMSDTFRVYTSPDIVGAELGGALKNGIIMCGEEGYREKEVAGCCPGGGMPVVGGLRIDSLFYGGGYRCECHNRWKCPDCAAGIRRSGRWR